MGRLIYVCVSEFDTERENPKASRQRWDATTDCILTNLTSLFWGGIITTPNIPEYSRYGEQTRPSADRKYSV